MGKIKSKALERAEVQVIGPQLGLCNDANSVIVTIALPHMNTVDELVCVLLSDKGKEINKQTKQYSDENYRNFVFKFSSLTPDKVYRYKFFDSNGSEIALEGSLTYDDCWFYGPAFNGQTDKFVLLSCNNPFHSGSDDEQKQFAMWDRLFNLIGERKDIRLIIQGGDQVYHDEIEILSLKKLKGNEDDAIAISWVRDQIIRNYQRFYAYINYRKILAHIPSIAMLDDHDITDGWGGRPESFVKNKIGVFHNYWHKYFELAYDAFLAYQACKNPQPVRRGAATTYLDLGDNRIFLMDYRAQKNYQKKILMKTDHENAVLDRIKDTNKRIFILSPVVPVRIKPNAEEGMGWAAKNAHPINKWLQGIREQRKLKSNKWGWVTFFINLGLGGTGAIAAYSDDIYDSLSSSVNRPYFLRLIKALSESMEKYDNEVIIMSGDIHTGGISEIFINGKDQVIPQIVSSPIGYMPMQKIVKNVTTTEDDCFIEDADIEVSFRNIYYRSDRNFSIIFPSRLHDSDGVEFHFESLTKPICSPAYFSPKNLTI